MAILRYGMVSTTATYWNLYLAQREGLFAREGLELRTPLTGSTGATVQQLLEGELDLAGCSPDEVVSAKLRGHDVVVIGGIIHRPVSWIVGRPGLSALHELRGARVGVNQTRGSVSMVLRAVLRRAGLGAGDYRQVVVGSTPAMAEALRRGEVDAAMLTAPFDLELAREGFALLANVGESFPTYAFTTVNARREWVLAHEAEVAAFFRATRAAGERIAGPDGREASLRALAAGTGLRREALEHTYQAYLAPGVLSRRGEVEPGGLEAVIGLMAEEGLLTGSAPPVESLLLPRWQ